MMKLEKVTRGRESIVIKLMMRVKKIEVGKNGGEREKHRKKKKPRNQTPSLR